MKKFFIIVLIIVIFLCLSKIGNMLNPDPTAQAQKNYHFSICRKHVTKAEKSYILVDKEHLVRVKVFHSHHGNVKSFHAYRMENEYDYSIPDNYKSARVPVSLLRESGFYDKYPDPSLIK